MEIRPVTIRDAEAIAEIRRQDGVREGVLGLSSERVSVTENFLRSFGEKDRGFVAVENGEIVGFAVMIANKEECRAHSAALAVMVDRDFQQRGIGGRLLSRITECADKHHAAVVRGRFVDEYLMGRLRAKEAAK